MDFFGVIFQIMIIGLMLMVVGFLAFEYPVPFISTVVIVGGLTYLFWPRGNEYIEDADDWG